MNNYPVLVLGCTGNTVHSFGTAALFIAHTGTGSNATSGFCAITALHMLTNSDNKTFFDSLLLKIGMNPNSHPKFLRVPLKHDPPRNYWVSPSGLDLVAIPLPATLLRDADVKCFTEDDIVAPETLNRFPVAPGTIVQMLCLQFEYWDNDDFLDPENLSVVRMGHISRLGFFKDFRGQHIRSHIVDIHSSPGNSGSTVVAWAPASDSMTSKPMFLGIVRGFPQELGAYEQYPLQANQSGDKKELELVSAQGTNRMILAIKTVANPSLTDITPVHELLTLRTSPEFIAATHLLDIDLKSYTESTSIAQALANK